MDKSQYPKRIRKERKVKGRGGKEREEEGREGEGRGGKEREEEGRKGKRREMIQSLTLTRFPHSD